MKQKNIFHNFWNAIIWQKKWKISDTTFNNQIHNSLQMPNAIVIFPVFKKLLEKKLREEAFKTLKYLILKFQFWEIQREKWAVGWMQLQPWINKLILSFFERKSSWTSISDVYFKLQMQWCIISLTAILKMWSIFYFLLISWLIINTDLIKFR